MEIIKTELEGVFIIKIKYSKMKEEYSLKHIIKMTLKKIIFVQNLKKVIFLFQIKM